MNQILSNPLNPVTISVSAPHFHPAGEYKMNHASKCFTSRQGLPHPDHTPPSFKSHHRCQCPPENLLTLFWKGTRSTLHLPTWAFSTQQHSHCSVITFCLPAQPIAWNLLQNRTNLSPSCFSYSCPLSPTMVSGIWYVLNKETKQNKNTSSLSSSLHTFLLPEIFYLSYSVGYYESCLFQDIFLSASALVSPYSASLFNIAIKECA